MPRKQLLYKSGDQLSSQSIAIWRLVQAFVWVVGVAILFCLLFFPATGILLFWNILIPVAPALFVLGTGVWRNICPLATTNLLPWHLGLSKRKKLSAVQIGALNLIAIIALFTIVPLRHALFNSSGMATALLIISVTAISVAVGLFYEWKSAWCSGLCPIHPVEKLYGGNVLITVPNAHCDRCMNCVVPCPDSTPNTNPTRSSARTTFHKICGFLITGGFPGFVWGWFHVPDETKLTTLAAFFSVYKMPVLGLAVTLCIYAFLLSIQPKFERKLTAIFAASAVACYYWYRLPALLGFGNYNRDGLLVNLQNVLPEWSVVVMTVAITIFFFYRLVISKRNKKSWVVRPSSLYKTFRRSPVKWCSPKSKRLKT